RPLVVVVGAGPTGLLLASELYRRGVACQLIDARPGPLHWDRATVVHPRSLEVFESLGLVERFLDAGTPQRGAKIHSGGEVLGAFDLSNCGSRYGFNLGVSEEVTESILTDYLHEQGGEVHRSSRLVGLTPQPDGVLAEIERDGDRDQVEARWVVGCDGIHGPTRDASGIRFVGHDIAEPWAVFDATLQGWAEAFDVTFVYLDDSYEAERRPAAKMVADSGDDFEHAQTMHDPTERQTRDQTLRATLTDPASRHHEAVAEAELNVDYSASPIISGDPTTNLAPGQRLPDTIPVQVSDTGPRRLHGLTHRAGHTLLLLAPVALGAGPDLPDHSGHLDRAGRCRRRRRARGRASRRG